MHSGILQKAVDELNKETPRLDYIRGLLETLIEISPKPSIVTPLLPPLLPPAHIGANGRPAISIGKLPKEQKDEV